MTDQTNQRYGLLFPSYWNGPTGTRILKYGGPEALLLGTFLTANDYANAIGLYELPIDAIHIGLPPLRLFAALTALDRAEFAAYDQPTRYVWVREMARFRMGLNNRNERLHVADKRVVLVNRLYSSVKSNPFVWAFFQRYKKSLHLSTGRKSPFTLIRRRGFACDGASHAPSDASRSEISTYRS